MFIKTLPKLFRTNDEGNDDYGFVDRIFLRDNKRRFNPWSSFDRYVVRDAANKSMLSNLDKLFPFT